MYKLMKNKVSLNRIKAALCGSKEEFSKLPHDSPIKKLFLHIDLNHLMRKRKELLENINGPLDLIPIGGIDSEYLMVLEQIYLLDNLRGKNLLQSFRRKLTKGKGDHGEYYRTIEEVRWAVLLTDLGYNVFFEEGLSNGKNVDLKVKTWLFEVYYPDSEDKDKIVEKVKDKTNGLKKNEKIIFLVRLDGVGWPDRGRSIGFRHTIEEIWKNVEKDPAIVLFYFVDYKIEDKFIEVTLRFNYQQEHRALVNQISRKMRINSRPPNISVE